MKRLVLVIAILAALTCLAVAQTAWVPITGIDTAASRYKAVEYLPTGVIWIAGGSSPFTGNYGYVSTDNGATWRQFGLPNTSTGSSSSTGISNLSALDANTALVGLNTGEVVRTTNGGVKWDTVYSYTNGWIDGVMFVTSTVAVAYGDDDGTGLMVARSTDAGATWTRSSSIPVTARPWGYYTYGRGMDVYNNTIWLSTYDAGGVNPALVKSTDAGATWTVLECVLPGGATYDYRFHSIGFKDELVGYAICRGLSSTQVEYVIKKTDGGATWSDTISVQNIWPHSMADPAGVIPIRGTDVVIAVGGSGASPYSPRAWRSTDAGTTWTTYELPGWRGFVMNAAFISATKGVAVGTYFAYMFDLPTAVSDPADLPTNFTLGQNYPNPFNPATTIPYSLATTANVELNVFDLLGRHVATLVNAVQGPGRYAVPFDASRLSSGVYVYTLRAGAFTESKQLVILK